jgi:hypothetical protein
MFTSGSSWGKWFAALDGNFSPAYDWVTSAEFVNDSTIAFGALIGSELWWKTLTKSSDAF